MKCSVPICLLALVAPATGWAFDDIINGEVSESVDDFPSTGGMLAGTQINYGGNDFDIKMLMCSSTLIAPDVVLLAAHCIDFSYYETMAGIAFDDADIGFSRLSDLTPWAGMPGTVWPDDIVLAWEAVPHPNFSMQTMDIGLAENDDIALLFLEEPILDVEPAILPTPAEAERIEEGADVDVVGWGQTTADRNPPPGTVGVKMQGESHIAEVSDYEFKVGDVQTDTRKCHGDSGGPTFMDLGDGQRLIGVTSHAYDYSDCYVTGGVDTRVDYYLDWIDDEMRMRCEDGTRVWCETDGIITPKWLAQQEAGETEEAKGCGCSATTMSNVHWWLFGMAGVIGLRRRRR